MQIHHFHGGNLESANAQEKTQLYYNLSKRERRENALIELFSWIVVLILFSGIAFVGINLLKLLFD